MAAITNTATVVIQAMRPRGTTTSWRIDSTVELPRASRGVRAGSFVPRWRRVRCGADPDCSVRGTRSGVRRRSHRCSHRGATLTVIYAVDVELDVCDGGWRRGPGGVATTVSFALDVPFELD